MCTETEEFYKVGPRLNKKNFVLATIPSDKTWRNLDDNIVKKTLLSPKTIWSNVITS